MLSSRRPETKYPVRGPPSPNLHKNRINPRSFVDTRRGYKMRYVGRFHTVVLK